MKIYTDIEESLIKLTPINGGDEIILPGVLQSLSVNGEILIDSNKSTGNGASQKIMRGYKDRIISLSLIILPTEEKTVYMILEELNKIFQNKEDNIPIVYTLFNYHTDARGIEKVLFTGLSSSEDNSTDTLTVTLTFEEFVEFSYHSSEE